MTTSSAAAPGRIPGRLFLALGLGLAALGVIGYAAQLWAQRLKAPWYMPISATLGVAFLVVVLWERRTVWRVLALVLVLLVAGAGWLFLLMTRLPEATGVIHPHAGPEGSDIDAPTTILVDRHGTVRWLYRSGEAIARLSPDEVLQAIDQHLPEDP